MKKFNISVACTDLTAIEHRSGMIRFIQSLGYPLEASPRTPPDSWPAIRAAFGSPPGNRLQTLFIEMAGITEHRLYPVLTSIATHAPWNLLFLTDTYDYLFICTVTATRLPDPSPGLTGESVYPSVQLHRIPLRNPSSMEMNLLENLTRTIDDDTAQFMKIRNACHRMTWRSPGARWLPFTPIDTDPVTEPERDLFHALRTMLKPRQTLAYSGTWPARTADIICPVLETAGFRTTPGRVTRKDLLSEPDLFVFEHDPETPGIVAIGACVISDPMQNPFSHTEEPESSQRIVHPDVHAARLFSMQPYRWVIVTDGRLWQFLTPDHPITDPWEFDLFQALRLDSLREHQPPAAFTTLFRILHNPGIHVSHQQEPPRSETGSMPSIARESCSVSAPERPSR
ncbi:hypothetical protein JXA80_13925, partial [bacterium]|nr:hypothetical protein [candidate division CSSED10-310 bacterium]